jgi:UDP-N-acetyl-D-mannosaminuronate dehydrogenase
MPANFWYIARKHIIEGKQMDSSTKICVCGLGHTGLPTSAIMAAKGFSVLGVDVNEKVVETINNDKIHIAEPDLVCEPNINEHSDFELCDIETALHQSDIIVLLVGHKQFKTIDRELLKPKIVIDSCGIW